MSTPITILFAVTFVAAGAVLVWSVYVTRLETRRRLAMLDKVADRFQDVRRGKSSWRYPRIEGSLDGSPVRLDLIPDSMVRKDVPSMWAEMIWERPQAGSLAITVDPRSAEYLTDCDIHQRRRLETPPDWPPRTHVCGEGQSGPRLLALLEDLDLKDYPHLKQLTVTPQGLSVTVRCARARRRPRLLVASNDFTTYPVKPEIVDEGLALLREVDDRLRAAAGD